MMKIMEINTLRKELMQSASGVIKTRTTQPTCHELQIAADAKVTAVTSKLIKADFQYKSFEQACML